MLMYGINQFSNIDRRAGFHIKDINIEGVGPLCFTVVGRITRIISAIA